MHQLIPLAAKDRPEFHKKFEAGRNLASLQFLVVPGIYTEPFRKHFLGQGRSFSPRPDCLCELPEVRFFAGCHGSASQTPACSNTPCDGVFYACLNSNDPEASRS